ncbi:tetratricopeptide repeat protein [Rhodospirillaceae bacterium SYSU D60014]|uniref:tetratricopeptide repeat protein n=1 Tax=Virgifigura deserti TaxID=2268457 RepID=UPI0013C53156
MRRYANLAPGLLAGGEPIVMKSCVLVLALIGLLVGIAPAARADLAAGIAAQESWDYETAYRELLPLAEGGNAEAQWRIGMMLHFGQGMPTDSGEAAQWYHRAIAQGHPDAAYHLGMIYHMGDPSEQDPVEAVRWYRFAAERGKAEAQFLLGDIYHYGWNGVSISITEAQHWYKRAAATLQADIANGEVYGQYFLARLYHAGQGVARDMREAARLYHAAAEINVAAAQMMLGYWYLRPTEKSADRELPLPDRDILTPDIIEAYKWYALAARHRRPHPDAEKMRDWIAERMVTEDLIEAKRRVEAWSPQPLPR